MYVRMYVYVCLCISQTDLSDLGIHVSRLDDEVVRSWQEVANGRQERLVFSHVGYCSLYVCMYVCM
jgi:hypothetical protein